MQFSFRRLFFKRKRPSILKFLYGMSQQTFLVFQDVFKTSSVRLHQDECLLGCLFSFFKFITRRRPKFFFGNKNIELRICFWIKETFLVAAYCNIFWIFWSIWTQGVNNFEKNLEKMESDSSELSNTVQKMTFSIKEFVSECDQMHRKFFVQCKIKVVLVIFSELIRKCFSLPTTGRFSKSVLVINCFMVGCILRTEIFNPLLK